jgi:hypothetical protein
VGVLVVVGVTVGVLVMVGVIVGVADGDTLTQGVLLLIQVAQSTQGPTIMSTYPGEGNAEVIDVIS